MQFSIGLLLMVVTLSFAGEPSSKAAASANGTNLFTVTGMTCEGCAKGLSSELRRVPGVVSVEVSLTNKQARVAYDTNRVSGKKLVKAIEEAGFKAKTIKP